MTHLPIDDHSQYSIGELDAWREVSILSSHFLPTRHFARIGARHQDRCFLFGRRGSGKSALAISSASLDNWDIHIIVQGEMEQYGAYLDLVRSLSARQQHGLSIDIKHFSELLWTYCIQVIVLQQLHRSLSSGVDDEHVFSLLSRTEEFLSKICALDRDIGLLLCDVHGEAIGKVPENSTDGLPATIALRERLADNDFRQCLSDIPYLVGKRSMLVIFDTLESYDIHTRPMREALRGVIGAVASVTARPYFNAIGIRYFLPAEIYEELAQDMPAKIADRSIFLRWRTGDLLAMLAARYCEMLVRTELINRQQREELERIVEDARSRVENEQEVKSIREDFWYANNLLPRTITNELGYEEDSFAYIFRHSQRRPRELILLMNSVIKKALGRGELPNISQASVREGVHDDATLSTLLADTLSPFRGYFDSVVDRARSIFAGRDRVMKGIGLKHFAKSLYDIGPSRTELDADRFLSFMLRAGLIGYVDNQDRCKDEATGYCKARFEYLMQDHIPLTNDAWYFVHPLLGDCLDMKSDGAWGVVYPEEYPDVPNDIA